MLVLYKIATPGMWCFDIKCKSWHSSNSYVQKLLKINFMFTFSNQILQFFRHY